MAKLIKPLLMKKLIAQFQSDWNALRNAHKYTAAGSLVPVLFPIVLSLFNKIQE
jgi:hypothetical protein